MNWHELELPAKVEETQLTREMRQELVKMQKRPRREPPPPFGHSFRRPPMDRFEPVKPLPNQLPLFGDDEDSS
jgi:hypothetical protein